MTPTSFKLNDFSDQHHIQAAKKGFEKGQTPEWVGKTVAALLTDPNIDSKAGRVIWCHDVKRGLSSLI